MSEKEKHKQKTVRHIVDVKKPGISAPSPTSKPVIVTNRPLLRDPMMVADVKDMPKTDTDNKDSEKHLEVADGGVATGGKPVIEPLDQTISEERAAADQLDDKTKSAVDDGADPAEDDIRQEPDSVPLSDDTPDEAPSTDATDLISTAQPKANDASAPGEIPPPDTSKSGVARQAEAEAAAQAKHDENIQQLVDSKRYALPITTIEQRKSKRFVVLGIALAVILIIIWLDIALDAGIIKLGGLKPLTHFFSN